MAKSDRELLELASKAAGVEVEWRRSAGAYYYDDHETGREEWSPLDDDGQALRLAVRLGIDIEWQHDSGYVKVYRTKMFGVWSGSVTELFCVGDAMAATRRAIVRAAAAIGEAMQ